MTPETLEELAVRCEKATEGEDFLDIDIAKALDLFADYFTSSLDAAMTLVPEASNFGTGIDDPDDNRPAGWAWVSGRRIEFEIVRAATPSLALCAASLRAKAKSL